jgi:hypothetical protein
MAIGEVLLGGGLAVAGGAGATLLQGWLQSKARAEERDERRRETRRAQVEHVLEELSDLVSAYYAQVIYLTQKILEKTDIVEGASSEMPPAPSAAKLEGLISIYFPECQPVVDDFKKVAGAIGTALADKIKEWFETHVLEHPENPKFIRTAHFVMATEIWERAQEFSKNSSMQCDLKLRSCGEARECGLQA